MTTIHDRIAILVASSKGGSGKTTFARGLIDYYRSQQGLTTAAFDADGGTESLLQYYGERSTSGALLPGNEQDPLKGVYHFSVRREEERDLLINMFDKVQAPRTVIDLPGGGEEEVEKILGNADRFFEAYEQLGVKPIVAIVINSIKSSAASVPAIMQMFGSRPHFIVVKNPVRGSRFRFFDGVKQGDGSMLYGNARKRVEAAKGEIITMPDLNKDTYEDLDFYSLKFQEAESDTRLMTTDRLRVAQWRKDFAKSLEGSALAASTSLKVVGAA